MKKARTLLAIWLALILTLTLFPTALAEPTAPNNDPTVPSTYQVYIDPNENIMISAPSSNPFNSDENGAVITFNVNDGYKLSGFQVYVDDAGHKTNECTLTEPTNDSESYTLTIPAGVITGKTSVKLFTEAASASAPENENDATLPATNENATLSYTLGSVTGGTAPAQQTVSKGGKVVVQNLSNTVPCNIFWYWMTPEGQEINGSRRVNPGNEITLNANLTLTANWLWAIDITLNANGGTLDGGTSAQVQWYKEGNSGDFNSYTLPSKEPTRAGFVFNGWECNGQTYDAGATIPFSATSDRTMTFTAQWSKGLTVNYDIGTSYNPGGGPKSGEVVDVKKPYTIPKDEPRRSSGSYEFGSWTLNINGKTYQPGATINWDEVGVTDATASVTFTANWSHMTYPDKGNDDKPSKPSKPTYDEYRIRATCSDGGWVSPAGSTYVREGRNLTVTFAPYKGYAIDGVYIDGVLDNRYDGSYTFRDVDENHTIYVRYVRDSGSSGGSSGGGSHWDDDTSPKTGDTSAPLSMGLGVGSLALIAFLVARKMRRA